MSGGVAPVVSVVIATRNRRQLLSETISTVLDQTFVDFEVIVVDDASTDDTVSFVRSLPDPRIRVVTRQERGERSMARNAGLATARGEFVMFLDDDDLLRVDALAHLVAALRSNPHALAASASCRAALPNGDSVLFYRPSREYTGFVWRELLFGWWSNSGQNLFRTDVVRRLGGFDPALSFAEDRKLWLAVAWRGPVCVVPRTAMDYRIHDGQSKTAAGGAIRRGVFEGFIATLPGDRQREGRRIRRAADLVDAADRARAESRFGAAIVAQLQACLLAPSLVWSPLTARPLWWGLKKSLLRVSAP